jgi:tRNA threonylcarbamoyladenosine biosynthesis protein TsaB
MKILAVDTASRYLLIGVIDGVREYEYCLDTNTRLSAVLVPTIRRIVCACGMRLEQIDHYVVGRGPGSFTGIRVGMAAAKALSWSLNKPLHGIVGLDILAGNAAGKASYCVPVVDARRDLLYAAVYALTAQGMRRLSPYFLLGPDDLERRIRRLLSKRMISSTVFLGDGLQAAGQVLRERLRDAAFLDKDYWRPQVKSMLVLARSAVEKRSAGSASRLLPLYLYPKECQIRTHDHRQ